jgi:hypothetical protein
MLILVGNKNSTQLDEQGRSLHMIISTSTMGRLTLKHPSHLEQETYIKLVVLLIENLDEKK